MAETLTIEEKKPTPTAPRWQQLQDQNIARATSLIKEHGADVEFLVIKDKFFLKEAVEPIININSSMDYLFRFEGRVLESKEVQDFRQKYAEVVNSLKGLEDMAVSMFVKADYSNVDLYSLRKAIRAKMNEKPVPAEVKAKK